MSNDIEHKAFWPEPEKEVMQIDFTAPIAWPTPVEWITTPIECRILKEVIYKCRN